MAAALHPLGAGMPSTSRPRYQPISISKIKHSKQTMPPTRPFHCRAARPAALAVLVLVVVPPAAAQQPYEANAQTDCYANNGSSVLGYTCRRHRTKNGTASSSPRSSCDAYLAFRAAPPYYASPITVSYLLNATASAVAAANAIVPVASAVEASRLLLVPVPCACTDAGYYQHEATYVIQSDDETYFTIANDTYQGLATCQALMAQNPAHDSLDLYPSISLAVPLRCACPSPAQRRRGVRYLVTYLLGWDDDSSTVAERFRADYRSVLDANSITDDSTVYPFTTMLVPLKDPPTPNMTTTLLEPPAPAPAPAASDQPAAKSTSRQSSAVNWRAIFFGAGVGCGVLVSGAVFALLLLWRCRRRRRRGDRSGSAVPDAPPPPSLLEYGVAAEIKQGADQATTAPWMTMAAGDVRDAVASSLTVYEYGELDTATAGFAEERRVGGSSVYRAVMTNGDAAAVKRVGGDVGAEVAVLGRANHARLVRLRGLCVHRGETHLVFELADNGALSDWLHGGAGAGGGGVLGWRQRVQVALDVADGLNYLHNYTSPPYVHKNLKSSNVLLDAGLRAKLSNFGLARAVVVSAAAGAGAGAQMTRHVVGTEGYLAPEYLEHGLIGPHLDVFAFGVVVLELLSGKDAAPVHRRVVSDGGDDELLLWQEAERLAIGGEGVPEDEVAAFMDARLHGDYQLDVAAALLRLALRCVAREPWARPSMGEVLLSLSAVYGSTSQCHPSDDPGNSGSMETWTRSVKRD